MISLKKRNFFARNKNKIARYGTIALNIMFVVGVGASAVLTKGTSLALTPAFAVTFIPSFFTLFFQVMLEVAPNKIEEAKNLFLKAVKDEEDVQTIEKAYNDVMTAYNSSRNSARSTEPTENTQQENLPLPQIQSEVNANIETRSVNYQTSPTNSDDGTIVQMNAYYNKKKNTIDVTPRVPQTPVPRLPPLGNKY